MNGRLSFRSPAVSFAAIAAFSLALLFGGLLSPGVASADADLGLTRPQPVSRDDPPPGLGPVGPGVGGATRAPAGMPASMPRKRKVVILPQPGGQESSDTSGTGTTPASNVPGSTTPGGASSATAPETLPNVGGGIYNTIMLILTAIGLALLALGSGTRLVSRKL